MTVIDKEGEIYDMDKKETFGGEIAKQLPVKDISINEQILSFAQTKDTLC